MVPPPGDRGGGRYSCSGCGVRVARVGRASARRGASDSPAGGRDAPPARAMDERPRSRPVAALDPGDPVNGSAGHRVEDVSVIVAHGALHASLGRWTFEPITL